MSDEQIDALPAVVATEPVLGRTHVPDTLRSIGLLLLSLDDERKALAAEGDHEALLGGLAFMRYLRQQMSVLERSTEDDAARLLGDLPRTGRARRWQFDGIGTVELQNQYPPRRWDDQATLGALVRAVLDPEGTGEVPDMTATEVAHLVAEAVAACARLEWRTGTTPNSTGVATFGLDPNEFRDEAGPPRVTVRITTTNPKD